MPDSIRRACDTLRPIAQDRDVAFIMNDRADLAAELGCDGVHVGQDDTPLPGTGIGEGQSGYQLGTEYLWRDNVALRLWLITSDVGADEDPYRVRLDLTFGVR